jgi:hypothetical protein
MRPRETKRSTRVNRTAAGLNAERFVRIEGPFRTSAAALEAAGALVEACQLERGLPPVSIVGDFVIPPVDGAPSRDFQTLHFDFGLPLDPKVAQDVACYTALHVPADVAQTSLTSTRQRALCHWSHCWDSAVGRAGRSSWND